MVLSRRTSKIHSINRSHSSSVRSIMINCSSLSPCSMATTICKRMRRRASIAKKVVQWTKEGWNPMRVIYSVDYTSSGLRLSRRWKSSMLTLRTDNSKMTVNMSVSSHRLSSATCRKRRVRRYPRRATWGCRMTLMRRWEAYSLIGSSRFICALSWRLRLSISQLTWSIAT